MGIARIGAFLAGLLRAIVRWKERRGHYVRNVNRFGGCHMWKKDWAEKRVFTIRRRL